MTAPQDLSEPAYMEVMPLADADAPDAPADPAPNAAFSADAAAKYDAVMEFCLNRGQVLFTTLMTEFVNIHLGDLERCITSKLVAMLDRAIVYAIYCWLGGALVLYLPVTAPSQYPMHQVQDPATAELAGSLAKSR